MRRVSLSHTQFFAESLSKLIRKNSLKIITLVFPGYDAPPVLLPGDVEIMPTTMSRTIFQKLLGNKGRKMAEARPEFCNMTIEREARLATKVSCRQGSMLGGVRNLAKADKIHFGGSNYIFDWDCHEKASN